MRVSGLRNDYEQGANLVSRDSKKERKNVRVGNFIAVSPRQEQEARALQQARTATTE